MSASSTSRISSRWTRRPLLPSPGALIALGLAGLAGVALSVLGIADTGPGDDLRRAASLVGLATGLVTLGATAVAAGRRRRGLFDAERRVEDLQRLAARVRQGRTDLEVDETLDHALNLADDLAAAGAFRQSVAVDRAIADVEDARELLKAPATADLGPN